MSSPAPMAAQQVPSPPRTPRGTAEQPLGGGAQGQIRGLGQRQCGRGGGVPRRSPSGTGFLSRRRPEDAEESQPGAAAG